MMPVGAAVVVIVLVGFGLLTDGVIRFIRLRGPATPEAHVAQLLDGHQASGTVEKGGNRFATMAGVDKTELRGVGVFGPLSPTPTATGLPGRTHIFVAVDFAAACGNKGDDRMIGLGHGADAFVVRLIFGATNEVTADSEGGKSADPVVIHVSRWTRQVHDLEELLAVVAGQKRAFDRIIEIGRKPERVTGANLPIGNRFAITVENTGRRSVACGQKLSAIVRRCRLIGRDERLGGGRFRSSPSLVCCGKKGSATDAGEHGEDSYDDKQLDEREAVVSRVFHGYAGYVARKNMLRLQAARRSPGAVKVTLKLPESVSTGEEAIQGDCSTDSV